MAEGQFSILLVDDDPDTRNLFATITGHYHVEFTAFQDAEAALEFLGSHAPDVIIIDLLLPGMDGFQALRQIRTRDLAPGSHMVAITAYHTDQTSAEVYERGFSGYLLKPVDPTTVIGYLQGVAGKEHVN